MKKKVLIIAAHPDDEILGCGGTIIKFLKQGCLVSVLYLSSGDSNENTREKEASRVCKTLGIKNYYFLRLKDKKFIVSSKNIERIIEIITAVQPHYVFVNHESDGDLEHKIAYNLVTEAFWRYNLLSRKSNPPINGLILYEIHKPLSEYNLIEDITNEMDAKMKIMSYYKSQLERFRIDFAIQALNKYRGMMQEGIEFAEVFKIKKMNMLP